MRSAKGDLYIGSKQVVQLMKDNGAEALEMDGGNKLGLMVRFMKEIGKTIEHMDKESSRILMVMSMKATGSMIKQMGMVYILM